MILSCGGGEVVLTHRSPPEISIVRRYLESCTIRRNRDCETTQRRGTVYTQLNNIEGIATSRRSSEPRPLDTMMCTVCNTGLEERKIENAREEEKAGKSRVDPSQLRSRFGLWRIFRLVSVKLFDCTYDSEYSTFTLKTSQCHSISKYNYGVILKSCHFLALLSSSFAYKAIHRKVT